MNVWNYCRGKWCDHRNIVQHISLSITGLIMYGMFTVSLASVSPSPTGVGSLQEHSVVFINSMAYLIMALFSALVGIILWNVKDLKNSIRANHEELRKEMKQKVSIQVHNAICENQIDVE